MRQVGHVAAATSTGGTNNKLPGRVGDSPILGAGTWAKDATCGISSTGHGELFIRTAAAAQVSARIQFGGGAGRGGGGGGGLGAAIRETLAEMDALRERETPGVGGMVGVDARTGEVVFDFTTPGMYRAWRHANGTAGELIWR
eukprot:g2685.t1